MYRQQQNADRAVRKGLCFCLLALLLCGCEQKELAVSQSSPGTAAVVPRGAEPRVRVYIRLGDGFTFSCPDAGWVFRSLSAMAHTAARSRKL